MDCLSKRAIFFRMSVYGINEHGLTGTTEGCTSSHPKSKCSMRKHFRRREIIKKGEATHSPSTVENRQVSEKEIDFLEEPAYKWSSPNHDADFEFLPEFNNPQLGTFPLPSDYGCDQGNPKVKVNLETQVRTHVPDQKTIGSRRDQGTMTEERLLNYLSADPRFHFMGAPSHYMEGRTARKLRRVILEAERMRGKYKKRFVPNGYLCLQKVETYTFPDGGVYRLEDNWVRNPVSKRTKTKSTQTPFITHR